MSQVLGAFKNICLEWLSENTSNYPSCDKKWIMQMLTFPMTSPCRISSSTFLEKGSRKEYRSSLNFCLAVILGNAFWPLLACCTFFLNFVCSVRLLTYRVSICFAAQSEAKRNSFNGWKFDIET